MSANQNVKTDERTVAVADASSRWGLNFILFALLVDIMYRAVVFNEAAWDLFVLLGISSAISAAYMARHKVLGQLLGWRVAILLVALAGVVGAIAAIVVTIIQAM